MRRYLRNSFHSGAAINSQLLLEFLPLKWCCCCCFRENEIGVREQFVREKAKNFVAFWKCDAVLVSLWLLLLHLPGSTVGRYHCFPTRNCWSCSSNNNNNNEFKMWSQSNVANVYIIDFQRSWACRVVAWHSHSHTHKRTHLKLSTIRREIWVVACNWASEMDIK